MTQNCEVHVSDRNHTPRWLNNEVPGLGERYPLPLGCLPLEVSLPLGTKEPLPRPKLLPMIDASFDHSSDLPLGAPRPLPL